MSVGEFSSLDSLCDHLKITDSCLKCRPVPKDPKQKKAWLNLFEKQERLRNTNTDLHLLTRAFSRIRSLERSVQVSIVDESVDPSGPNEVTRFEKLIDEPLVYSCVSRAFSVVLEALAVSTLHVHTFKVLLADLDPGHDGQGFAQLSSAQLTLDHARSAFRHLKELHLDLGLFEKESRALVTDAEVDVFCEFLASASEIEHLSITMLLDLVSDKYRNHERLVGVLSTRLHRLRTLDMQGFNIGPR